MYEESGQAVKPSLNDNVPSPANLLTLPDSHTKKATFPPSCPVLVYGHDIAPVFTGKVASICIDISPGSDRSFLYCIKPEFPLPGMPSKVTVMEPKIRFAPDCPVVVTLNGSSNDGIVRSMCEVGEEHGHVPMYTVHLLNAIENGSPGRSLRHGVAPKELKFRFGGTYDGTAIGALTEQPNMVVSAFEEGEDHSTKKTFGKDGNKCHGIADEEGEIVEDIENRIKTSNYDNFEQQQQGRLFTPASAAEESEENGSILGDSTRSQTSIGSFSFSIKSGSNEVAFVVGIVNALERHKVRGKGQKLMRLLPR